MRLNGWEEVAAKAAGAYATGGASLAAEIPQGGGGDSPGGMLPSSTATTVSPTFQQSFTPQVSPVIQVSQGGGAQTGAASQRVMESQQARGGGASAGLPMPGGALSPGTSDALDISPAFFDRQTAPQGFFEETGFREMFQTRDGINYLPWIGGGLLLLAGFYFINTRPKQGKKS